MINKIKNVYLRRLALIGVTPVVALILLASYVADLGLNLGMTFWLCTKVYFTKCLKEVDYMFSSTWKDR